jgi:hypothetical protein
MDKVQLLRDLGNQHNIRDARKLYQLAQQKGHVTGRNGITQADAVEALKTSVQRQLLAPKPRYRGHFASSAPQKDLQMDLIDFSKSTKKGAKYAVVGTDVFTRFTAMEPIPNKQPQTVKDAYEKIIHKISGTTPGVLTTTDKGGEWKDVQNLRSERGDIHQYADVNNPNGVAVVDASIKHIKRDLAAEVGKEKGSNWADKADKVVSDINSQV